MQEPQKLFNRNFLLQWQGQTVSRVGSQLFSAAMVFWIKRATGSASIMGLLSLLSGLPAVLLTPIGGAFADRFSRRKIMIICDLVRGIALLALTTLIFLRPEATGVILGGIFAFAILNAAVNSFFGPAISATIPDLVPTDRVTSANSLGQLSMQVSVFLGQGLGGVLFRILGAPLLFLVNALSFFYASASEVFVTIPQTIPERRGTVREQFRMFGQEIVEGLRYVRSRPGLRELVIISTVLSFFLAPIVVLLPFYVEDTLGLTTDWYGFILVAFGVGTLLGYILGGVLNLNGGSRARAIIGLTFVNTLAYGMLGVVQNGVPVLFLAVLGGLGSGFVTLNITTLVQVTTPSDIRGRVMGLLATLSAALTPIAAGLAGIIADLVNQNIGLIYSACGAITFVAAALIATNKSYRRILATDLQQARSAQLTAGTAPVAQMDPLERTRDVYESIPGYPQPPVVPIPAPDDLDEVLAGLGQPVGSTARQITDRTFRLTGIRSFMEQLPDRYEALARQHNMRLPGLYAPVISATLALQDDPRSLDPLQRAATLILGVRELQRAVFSGSLPADTLRGEALEMGQYPGFFSTSQVIDGPLTKVYKSKVFSKVNVIIDGCFYLIDIGEPDASLSAADLVCTLSELVSRTRRAPRTASPGSLTCTSDATQVRQFNRLRRIGGNAASLDALKHSLFTLALDLDDAPATLADAARVAHSQNPENRWFHASLQIVVFGNAQACAICNFSTYLDGNVMMRGAAEIQRRAAAAPVEESAGSALPSHPLSWNIPPLMLERAKPDRQRVLDDQQSTFELPGYGRDFFDRYHVNPVPGFICALQMTANALTGQPVKVVQFLAMSRYRCTDLVSAYVSTPPLQEFAGYMQAAQVDPVQARKLLDSAVEAQSATMRNARKWLPMPVIVNLFIRSQTGWRRLAVSNLFRFRQQRLERLGAFKGMQRDVLISHPEIYPEVPIVGRPGVRLPYVTYFGLHYQMLPDKTVVTLMPAVDWQTSNRQIIEALRASLDQVRDVLERATP